MDHLQLDQQLSTPNQLHQARLAVDLAVDSVVAVFAGAGAFVPALCAAHQVCQVSVVLGLSGQTRSCPQAKSIGARAFASLGQSIGRQLHQPRCPCSSSLGVMAEPGSPGAPAEAPKRHKGVTKWFNATKGYGFVTPIVEGDEQPEEIFVHQVRSE
jgi:hypothetical protein